MNFQSVSLQKNRRQQMLRGVFGFGFIQISHFKAVTEKCSRNLAASLCLSPQTFAFCQYEAVPFLTFQTLQILVASRFQLCGRGVDRASADDNLARS